MMVDCLLHKSIKTSYWSLTSTSAQTQESSVISSTKALFSGRGVSIALQTSAATGLDGHFLCKAYA